ncbi:MAG: DUF1877 family protein [Nostoc sp.]|uniref:DUF1877 family protein n=1 Tax=Nostoc sp. TaxID=1180 RepID=UPI002FFC920F
MQNTLVQIRYGNRGKFQTNIRIYFRDRETRFICVELVSSCKRSPRNRRSSTSTYLLKKKGINHNLDALIAEEQWRIGRLDIDSYWHAIHYLLTEDISSWEECQIPFIVARKEENNRLLINAVMGRTSIEGTKGSFKDFGPVKYLVPSETQQISEALLQISEKEFTKRYEEACVLNPDVYRTLWDEKVDEYWYIFQCISEYYRIAAEETRGMLLYLGCFSGVDFMWEMQD